MTDLDRLLWAVAGAKRDCPGPTDAGENLDYYVYSTSEQPHSPHCRCNGSGQVYALPAAVRLLCQWAAIDRGRNGITDCMREGPDCDCHGLGWTPAQDLETWLGRGLSIGIHHLDVDYENDKVYIILTPEGMDSEEAADDPNWRGRGSGKSFQIAYLQALAQAIVAQGATLMEVPGDS